LINCIQLKKILPISISISEIKARASVFAERWKNDTYERGSSQTFYNEFFAIFDIDRKNVAFFEKQIKKINKTQGFIDLFWPGVLIAEQKSAGRDLDAALTQAEGYVSSLHLSEYPTHLLVCDFQNFQLVNIKEEKKYDFKLSELPEMMKHFDFMRRLEQNESIDEIAVNTKASEIMGKIYDLLEENHYKKHNMVILLTRLTYCLFADDTGIFNPANIFQRYLKDRTSVDGTDLGPRLNHLFQILNQSVSTRPNNLEGELKQFPFINGDLFELSIGTPSFDSKMRTLLIKACEFDWSKVSPAIFGSMFQSVMNKEERRESGGHYTSESNILKVIKSLFLDELYEEFNQINSIRTNSKGKKLENFQEKLNNLKFLDPACGSGNFLIITYQEIRRLELKVILQLHDQKTKLLDISSLSKVNVDQFYGIEINEFSSNIAEIALWMMDHLMNVELGQKYGDAYARIPLDKHPNIVNKDALDIDWNDVLPSSECSYILGNPPFIGTQYQSPKQSNQIKKLLDEDEDGGLLDYVCGWFLKAGLYVNEKTSIGFVATNSTTQGQQVGQLWPLLFDKYYLKLNFAYQQFKWTSEARGKAGVTVVILGLSKNNKKEKRLFTHYEDEIIEENPLHITPYLIGSDIFLPIVKRSSKPLNGLKKLLTGTMPIDGNYYLFTDIQKSEFLKKEPAAEFLFRPYLGSKEFLHDEERWILNVHDVEPNKFRNLPQTRKRIALVKSYRLSSKRPKTKKMADTPTDYDITQIPTEPFLVIPEHSSETRDYIPIGFMKPPTIPSNKVKILPNASIELFGLLTSKMHNIWNNFIGGKLEKRNIYSIGMVYNTFPVPDTKLDSLKIFAEKILDERKKCSNSTLADMYAQNTMPSNLRKAHQNLDNAVEKLYRKEPFKSEQEIIEFLLSKYKEMIS